MTCTDVISDGGLDPRNVALQSDDFAKVIHIGVKVIEKATGDVGIVTRSVPLEELSGEELDIEHDAEIGEQYWYVLWKSGVSLNEELYCHESELIILPSGDEKYKEVQLIAELKQEIESLKKELQKVTRERDEYRKSSESFVGTSVSRQSKSGVDVATLLERKFNDLSETQKSRIRGIMNQYRGIHGGC